MIKIAHESPKSIFDLVQKATDYDYALVHLFEEDEEYYNEFVEAKNKGREIILDNSVFELETAFDSSRFVEWVEKLKPTWYIIPDVLENSEQTIRNVIEWNEKYKPMITESKSIGVVQGKTYNEIVACYEAIEPLVDKVAISFDYSFLKSDMDLPTKYHHYMYGRQRLLAMLVEEDIINTAKPHHLLGCGLPQEFSAYTDYKWIDSIDTSNPVVAGMKGMMYNGTLGLEDKPSEKLFTLINAETTVDQNVRIFYNIEMFRKICHGNTKTL